MVGNENILKEDAVCSDCKEKIEDNKSAALCTLCKMLYHVSCESVDLHGFHLRKSSWKCKACECVTYKIKSKCQTGENQKEKPHRGNLRTKWGRSY